MNLVLDDATEFNKDGTPKGKIGTDRIILKSRKLKPGNYCRSDCGEREQCRHAGGERQALNYPRQQSAHFLSN